MILISSFLGFGAKNANGYLDPCPLRTVTEIKTYPITNKYKPFMVLSVNLSIFTKREKKRSLKRSTVNSVTNNQQQQVVKCATANCTRARDYR